MKNALTPCEKLENDCYDWYERHAQKCMEAKSGNHDLILIGDSITHFWETHLAPENYKETFKNINVMNLGFGWDRTCNVLWRLQHGEFEGQTPKHVIMHIGTNNQSVTDNYPGDTPTAIAEGIKAITELIHHLSPETQITVMSVFQRGDNTLPFRKNIRAINKEIDRILTDISYVEILNISEKFMLSDGSDLDNSCFNDGCHPNSKGYAIWSQAIAPILAPLRKN